MRTSNCSLCGAVNSATAYRMGENGYTWLCRGCHPYFLTEISRNSCKFCSSRDKLAFSSSLCGNACIKCRRRLRLSSANATKPCSVCVRQERSIVMYDKKLKRLICINCWHDEHLPVSQRVCTICGGTKEVLASSRLKRLACQACIWRSRTEVRKVRKIIIGFCEICKIEKRVHKNRLSGVFLCDNCVKQHQREKRKCSRCKRTGIIDKITRGGKAICHSCYQDDRECETATHEECLACNKTRIVYARINGIALCRYCHIQNNKRKCVKCDKVRRVAMNTEDGPICEACRRKRFMEACVDCKSGLQPIASRVDGNARCAKHTSAFYRERRKSKTADI